MVSVAPNDCVGTIVNANPYVVLTAASCYRTGAVGYVRDYTGNVKPWTSENWVLHPNYVYNELNLALATSLIPNDIALIIFADQSTTLTPVTLPSQS